MTHSGKHPVNEKPSPLALPTKGPIQAPGRLYSNHPGARGLHPSGALVRTLWQIKSPPDDSVRITWGLKGYCRGPNTRVPNEVELITIER